LNAWFINNTAFDLHENFTSNALLANKMNLINKDSKSPLLAFCFAKQRQKIQF